MAICTTIPYYISRTIEDQQNNNECCDLEKSELEVAIGRFYEEIMPFLNKYREQILQKELFGFPEELEKLYNTVNDLHYLGLYFSLMYGQRELDNHCKDCDDEKKGSEYTEFDCMKSYFACTGMNIDPLLTIFGFGLPDDCGINYMCIEEADDSCVCPIFQVNIDCDE